MRKTKSKICYCTDEIWTRVHCPDCNAVNWIYLGRTDRDTDPDIDAMQCYSCGIKSWISEYVRDDMLKQFEDDEDYDEDCSEEDLIEEAWIALGVDQPK